MVFLPPPEYVGAVCLSNVKTRTPRPEKGRGHSPGRTYTAAAVRPLDRLTQRDCRWFTPCAATAARPDREVFIRGLAPSAPRVPGRSTAGGLPGLVPPGCARSYVGPSWPGCRRSPTRCRSRGRTGVPVHMPKGLADCLGGRAFGHYRRPIPGDSIFGPVRSCVGAEVTQHAHRRRGPIDGTGPSHRCRSARCREPARRRADGPCAIPGGPAWDRR